MKNVLAIGKAPTQPREPWLMEFSGNMIEALKEGTPPVRLSAREWTDGRVLIYLEYVEDPGGRWYMDPQHLEVPDGPEINRGPSDDG